jgi:polyhydroxyalkanoate synthesis regulator phasin
LTSLIRAGGDRLSALQRGLLTPLGLWSQVDEEIKRRVQGLVNLGEMSEIDGAELIEKMLDMGKRLREEKGTKETDSGKEEGTRFSASDVETFLRKRQLPTQLDLKRLSEQLAELEAKLEEISQPSSRPE